MNCEYQSLKDFISPDETAQYIQHLNQASKALAYSVNW
jgi:hypothetical protein